MDEIYLGDLPALYEPEEATEAPDLTIIVGDGLRNIQFRACPEDATVTVTTQADDDDYLTFDAADFSLMAELLIRQATRV